MLSVSPTLVADINQTLTGSTFKWLDTVGDSAYLLASIAPLPRGDYGLWKTDGTTAGTVLVKDGFGPTLGAGINVNGTLYFSANDGTHGQELWKSDGTLQGTQMVKEIVPGDGDGIGSMVNLAGTLYFVADYGNNVGVFRSDGTAAGTVLAASVPSPATLSGVLLATAGDNLIVDNVSPFKGLYRLNGAQLESLGSAQVNFGASANTFANVGSELYFAGATSATGTELWKTDGTVAGTTLVKDIVAGSGSSSPIRLTNVDGTLFFAASGKLWKSDGTSDGTQQVQQDLSHMVSNPVDLTNFNGTLAFSASGPDGTGMYLSDGTSVGTTFVTSGAWTDISVSGFPPPQVVGDHLYFLRNLQDVWVTDGTAVGTVQLAHFGVIPVFGPNVGGRFLFFANFNNASGTAGAWASDGTVGGTSQFKLFNSNTNGSLTSQTLDVPMGVLGGVAYFAANDGTSGNELWKSDGTAGGTVRVGDINPGAGSSNPAGFTVVSGVLYFTADDGTHGVELWRTDGTAAGTYLVKDTSASTNYPPSKLTAVGNQLFFTANGGAGGASLWVSDGTAAGTHLVTDGANRPAWLVNLNGELIFADRGVLATSDGTLGGTGFVGSGFFADGVDAVRVGNYVYFAAHTENGDELWRTDGSVSGTTSVSIVLPGAALNSTIQDFRVFGDHFTFSAKATPTGTADLWISDGTSAGTSKVSSLRPGLTPAQLPMPAGDELYFWASDGVNPQQLWKTDGTAAGTVLVRNFDGSPQDRFAVINGRLYFVFQDATHGAELWTTDGTTAGTQLVNEIQPGSQSSSPFNLTNVAGQLLFGATGVAVGRELFSVAAEPVVAQLFYNHSAYDGGAGIDAGDDGAIASDKLPYLPGDTGATFASVSSYSKGINGLMVDIPGTHPAVTAADFTFKVGNNNAPGLWADAPAPISVSVRAGAGSNGADRVELIWADGAIKNTWLQVTVAANAQTGLATPYTFYFGSAVGDSGFGDTTGMATVNVTDELGARNHPQSLADQIPLTNFYDFNRDGAVDVADQLIARNGVTNLGNALRLINIAEPPLASPLPQVASAALPSAGAIDSGIVLATPSSFVAAPPVSWLVTTMGALGATAASPSAAATDRAMGQGFESRQATAEESSLDELIELLARSA